MFTSFVSGRACSDVNIHDLRDVISAVHFRRATHTEVFAISLYVKWRKNFVLYKTSIPRDGSVTNSAWKQVNLVDISLTYIAASLCETKTTFPEKPSVDTKSQFVHKDPNMCKLRSYLNRLRVCEILIP